MCLVLYRQNLHLMLTWGDGVLFSPNCRWSILEVIYRLCNTGYRGGIMYSSWLMVACWIQPNLFTQICSFENAYVLRIIYDWIKVNKHQNYLHIRETLEKKLIAVKLFRKTLSLLQIAWLKRNTSLKDINLDRKSYFNENKIWHNFIFYSSASFLVLLNHLVLTLTS